MINFFWKSLPTSEWVKLLAVPLVLSIGGSIITSQFQQENKQNETMNKYFDQMQQLFLKSELNLSEPNNPVRLLIKSISLATLKSTDLKRKEVIISFLAGAEPSLLDSRKKKDHYNVRNENNYKEGVSLSYLDLTTISLSGLNLTGTNFNNTDLERANLEGVNLEKAYLKGANLYQANLYRADLGQAYLEEANLEKANLSLTRLVGTHLRRADLRGANLIAANLSRADLSEANLKGANLINTMDTLNKSDIKLTWSKIKSACFWDKAIYQGDPNTKQNKFIVDQKANREYIEQLKQDRSSEPKQKPDCSRWK